jgi:hypothetical protein
MKEITKIWRKPNLVKLISISFIVLVLVCVVWLTLSWQMQTKTKANMTRATPTEADRASQPLASDAYGKLPLSFELNQGQTDEQVKFLSRGSGYSVFLNSSEIVTTLRKPLIDEKSAKSQLAKPQKQETAIDAVLRMKFVGGNSQPVVEGMDELPGRVNYLVGNDPKKWRTEIPTYSKVKYTQVYPDIDAVFYGNQKNPEFDFIVAPGADPKVIELAFDGADKIEIGEQGDLILDIADGKIHLDEPRIFQEINGNKQPVTGGYVLNPKSETGKSSLQTVGFRVDAYDATKPLIIDPILVYSTYLGGSSSDFGEAVAVDAVGHALVTGITSSVNFPAVGSLPPSVRGIGDVFVTKFYGDGSALIYSTYFGGSQPEIGFDIAVDAAGNAYLTGSTSSPDFPTLNAVQPTLNGGSDAFVTKLNPTGSALIFSTYLGGSGIENLGEGSIAIDAATNVYVTGRTESNNFPTTPGAFQTTPGGGIADAFVTKLDATGSSLVYSTRLGGNRSEFGGTGVAADADGNAYVVGYTQSANFPTTPGAFQTTSGGMEDAYVVKLNPSGSALVYSTYLGGQNSEVGTGITLDANNQAYITGGSRSTNFPTTPSAFQTTYRGGDFDVFVTKLNSAGSALVYSTYIGGTGNLVNGDLAESIAVDSAGNAHVTGATTSTDFPTANPFQLFRGGGDDVFVLKLNSAGSALIYSTYLGGSGNERGQGIALDQSGNAYITGGTDSLNFHVYNAFQPQHGGSQFDAFVAKIVDNSGGQFDIFAAKVADTGIKSKRASP